MPETKQYHIGSADGTQSGPHGIETIIEKILSEEVSAQTLIWSVGMKDWQSCDSFREFQPHLAAVAASKTPPPLPRFATSVPASQSYADFPPPLPRAADVPTPAPDAGTVQATIWNPVSALVYNLRNYAKFDGRASRDEYWNFVLALFVATGVSFFLPFVPIIIVLALLVPSLGCAVRRLHDCGKSWHFILFGIIPIVGTIITTIFAVLPSTPANEFGERAAAPITIPQIQKYPFFSNRKLFVSVGIGISVVCHILMLLIMASLSS